jgi:hypothetical protein
MLRVRLVGMWIRKLMPETEASEALAPAMEIPLGATLSVTPSLHNNPKEVAPQGKGIALTLSDVLWGYSAW